MPGVAEANQSSVPLVSITSDIDLRDRDRGTLTEHNCFVRLRHMAAKSHLPIQSRSREIPCLRATHRQAIYKGGKQWECPDWDVTVMPYHND